jgi:hypothetical protein
MWPCVKCGAAATLESAETDTPLCAAHGGGEPSFAEPDDFDTQLQAEDSYFDTDMPREV